VYRATNRLTRQTVALKLLAPGRSQGQAEEGSEASIKSRVTLAREFQTLSSLHHPNVIRVFDYGFDEDAGPYFTMELLPSPRDFVTAFGDCAPKDKLQPLVDLLRALVYVHRRNIIHRDLKPSNVLVAGGRVHVLDFGIALAAKSATGQAGGTLGYIAPEVLLGGAPSVASDLFAVGVLAYQLFAGQFPYDLSSASSFLRGVLQRTMSDVTAEKTMIALAFLALGERADEGPERSVGPVPLEGLGELTLPLNRIIMRLLAPEPEERYPSAEAVIGDLGEALGVRLAVDTADTRESFLKAADFVGREDELHQLLQAMRAAERGNGSAWLVGGESGVGKSRLVDELRTLALVRNAQVLRGRATREHARPYQPWAPLLRALALYVGVSDEEASVLKDIVPDLGTVLDRDVAAPPPLPPALARDRIYDTVARVLSRHREPLVLLLEDLHWADADSITLLDYVSSRAGELPLLLVGNYRNDERPDLPQALPQLSVMPLKRLTREVVRSLVTSMLGPAGDSPELTDFLERETEGNAFFLVEVVRALAEETTHLADVARIALPEHIVTGGMEQILHRRLTRVPEDKLPLLRLAAVSGRQVDPRVLALASGEAEVEGWLMTAANAAVLEAREGAWLFSHDKLRERILAELPEADTVRLNLEVARALETVHGDSTERHPALAYHYKRAVVPEKAVDYFIKAGNESLRLFAVVDARTYYSEALELLAVLPDTAERRRSRIDIAIRQANLWWSAVPYAQTIALVTEAEALLGSTRDEDRSAADHARAAFLCLYRGRAVYASGRTMESLETYRQGLEHAEKAGDKPLELLLKGSMGQSLGITGYLRDAQPYLERALDVLAQTGNSADWCRIAGFVGFNLAGLGRLREAHAIQAASLERARELKYTRYVGLAHLYRSLPPFFVEDWSAMRRELEEAVRIALATKDLVIACTSTALTEWAAVRLGDRNVADRARAQCQPLVTHLGGFTLDAWHAACEIDRALAFGAPEDALPIAERVVTQVKERGSLIGQHFAHRSWARALLGMGRYEEAEEKLKESIRVSALGGIDLLSARAHLAWAELCRARGDSRGADEQAAIAARLVQD
jgi:tetratricopeptide (TPR) repeat protein